MANTTQPAFGQCQAKGLAAILLSIGRYSPFNRGSLILLDEQGVTFIDSVLQRGYQDVGRTRSNVLFSLG